MWAELALNESKQGIIRNRFTFFLLFLFLCNGSIIRRCASGRGGKAPQPRACPSVGGLAVRLARRRTERCCKARFEVGAGHTPGLIPAALGLPEKQDKAPLPTASPASGCVTACPGPRAQSPPDRWKLLLPSGRRGAGFQRQLHVRILEAPIWEVHEFLI